MANITVIPSDFICTCKTNWCLVLWSLKHCCCFFFSSPHSLNSMSSLLHLLLMKPHACFTFAFSLSSCIPLRTRRWQERHWRWHMKSIQTEAIVLAPHILSFYTSPTSDTCGFFKDKRHGVISVPVTSAHSYWFLVFFPLLVYVESVVCLCSASVGGLCPFVWKTHQTVARGTHDALDRIGMVIFCSIRLSLTLVIVFHFLPFYGKHHKTEERRTSSHLCFRCLLEKCIIFWKEKCCFISKTKHELVWNYSVKFRWSKQLSATLHVSTHSFSLLLGGKSVRYTSWSGELTQLIERNIVSFNSLLFSVPRCALWW